MKFFRCLSFAMMLIAFLVCCPFTLLVNGEDNKCKDVKKLEYELFGTKTIYEDARKFLKKSDLPKSFDDDSLEEEDEDLRKKGSCKPITFYFIGRHAARFPDAEDIEKYNADLSNLVEQIKEKSTCSEIRDEFTKWRSKMIPKYDNLITHLGAQEERNIAKRFKRIYPEFFDTKKANIQIGVTKKWRTAQTAAQYLKEVEGLEIPHCNELSLPTDDIDDPRYNLDNVLGAACYRYMIDNFERPFLAMKKGEKSSSSVPEIEHPLVEMVEKSHLKKDIAEKISKKLGLDKDTISADVLDSIFNTCKFENAIKDDSIWCKLFSKDDIKALEFIGDVSTYIESAYGPTANAEQARPMVGELVHAFHEAIKSTDGQPKSYFYFSHAGPMKKLFATLGLFRDDESFSEETLRKFATDLKVPKKRGWRTSVISPFSANMAFILYRCNKSNNLIKYKVLATVNEQPVKLGGCDDTDCRSERFFNSYSWNSTFPMVQPVSS